MFLTILDFNFVLDTNILIYYMIGLVIYFIIKYTLKNNLLIG